MVKYHYLLYTIYHLNEMIISNAMSFYLNSSIRKIADKWWEKMFPRAKSQSEMRETRAASDVEKFVRFIPDWGRSASEIVSLDETRFLYQIFNTFTFRISSRIGKQEYASPLHRHEPRLNSVYIQIYSDIQLCYIFILIIDENNTFYTWDCMREKWCRYGGEHCPFTLRSNIIIIEKKWQMRIGFRDSY